MDEIRCFGGGHYRKFFAFAFLFFMDEIVTLFPRGQVFFFFHGRVDGSFYLALGWAGGAVPVGWVEF